MISNVSALSSVVAKSHQAIHFVSSTPSIHSVRRVFPSTAGSQPWPPAPFRNLSGLRLTQELPFIRFWPFLIQASGTAAVPTGPWLSTVYHVRACKRYYGLIRQSDELRPAWLSQLTLAGLCPCRAVRLTFPSLAVVYGRACFSRGLPQPESAITTRPNRPLPRQDFYLQACQRLKAAHRNLLCAPTRTDRCAGEGELISGLLITPGPSLSGGKYLCKVLFVYFRLSARALRQKLQDT
jgi:hypothetical protein